MIDAEHQVTATRRQVGTRVLEAGEVRTGTIGQVYDTTIEDLWDACTSAERIPRWFLPVSGDLRLGGRYQLEGNAGGTVLTCDPPHGFTATWEYDGETTWIEVHLRVEPDGRTRFELEHIVPIDDARWAEFGPGATGVGWELGLLGLATHLTSGTSVDPVAFAAWTESDDGRHFVAMSSERWGDADVEAGTAADEARAAAARTTAAYAPET